MALVIAVPATVLALACSARTGASPTVAVYPLAGTPDASPATEISFRGAPAGELAGISVVGSKSGPVPGRLVEHSDGEGASFLPAKPLVPGETVRVEGDVPLVGERGGAVSFRIALPPGAMRPQQAFPDGATPAAPGTNRYRTRPDLRPPAAKVTVSSPAASPRDVFLAPKSGPGQDGPLILDAKGDVVWFHPLRPGYKSYDFRVQRYDGKPVLTWWQGTAAGAYGGGVGVIVDDAYRLVATVKGADGYRPDIHEFRLTPAGTALVLSYRAVRWDLRPAGGPARAAVLDVVVEEIDVKTGLVVFQWHALGHIPLTETYAVYKQGSPFDYAHLNSVAVEPDGNLLVSSRNTSTAYEIDRQTGRILWRLGGKHSTFALPRGAQFVGQHDVEPNPDGTVSLFDDGNIAPPPGRTTRALVFSVGASAKLEAAFPQPHGLKTFSQGNVQRLDDGHYVVGWGGGIPEVSEFGPSGALLFDLRLLTKGESYRAYRFPWHATPTRPPDVAAETAQGTTLVYASWNGATDVASWQVLGGPDPGSLSVVGSAPRTGFETQIAVPGTLQSVAVRALDAGGKTLGTSQAIAPS